MENLKTILAAGPTTVVPGVNDAQSLQTVIQQKQFPTVYLNGYDLTYSLLAQKNEGLISPSEVAATLRHMREYNELPILVDAASGFGNQLTAYYVVRDFERSGAAGVVINDQMFPSHTSSNKDVSLKLLAFNEFVAKLKAARGALENPQTLVMAKLDGIKVYGDEQLAKRIVYLQDHDLADLVLVDGLQSKQDLTQVASLASQMPLGVVLNIQLHPELKQMITSYSDFKAVFYIGGVTAARGTAEAALLAHLG